MFLSILIFHFLNQVYSYVFNFIRCNFKRYYIFIFLFKYFIVCVQKCNQFMNVYVVSWYFAEFIDWFNYFLCLTSLITREMQIKTNMRYHLTPVRIAIINKSTNAREGVEKRVPSYTVGRNVYWYNHYEKQYEGTSEN